MCVSLRSWCVCAAVLLFIAQEARAQNGKLVWDHADSSAVTLGYSVTIDGMTTDYGVSPIGAGPGGSRGCAISLPFSGGYHTISVTAYNVFGKTQSGVFPVGPVAEAGAPYSSQAGQPVTLDGGGSVSPNGWITESLMALGRRYRANELPISHSVACLRWSRDIQRCFDDHRQRRRARIVNGRCDDRRTLKLERSGTAASPGRDTLRKHDERL